MIDTRKKVLYMWNDEAHSLESARRHGVLATIEVPKGTTPEFISGFQTALSIVNREHAHLSLRLKLEVDFLTPYSVKGEVLEWNEYSVEVYARDSKHAAELALDEGLVSFTSNDVTYGSSSYAEGELTHDRHIKVTN